MIRESVAAALLAVAIIGCSSPPPPAPELDAAAQTACDAFAPIGGEIRTGELEGPQLYRALQDVWDYAQRSDNAEVRNAAQTLLTTAIQDDQQAMNAAVTALQQACSLPFS